MQQFKDAVRKACLPAVWGQGVKLAREKAVTRSSQSSSAEGEITLRVRYEDGNAGTASKRLPWTDVPASIRSDFERRGGTRVFRTWVFPWARARAL